MLPLYVLDEPGVRKLLPIGIGLSDYIDALVDPAWPEAGEAMLAAIADIPDWDECHLPDLPEGGVLHGARGPAGLAEERRDSGPCPVLMLPESADALDAVVPRKTLRDVRQAASRAEAAGGVRIETADADTLPSMLDDLFRLHEARWRSRGEPGVLADPAVRAFHRDAAPALAAEGMLRLYRMRIGGDGRGGLLRVCVAGPGLCLYRRVRPGHAAAQPRRADPASRDRRGDRRGMRRVRFSARRREL